MSHFTVMLAIPDAKTRIYGESEETEKDGEFMEDLIHAMMRPYQENNMGDCPREFMAFNDVEDENLKEYKSKLWEGWEKVQSNGKKRYMSDFSRELEKIDEPIATRLRKELGKDGFWGIGCPKPKEVLKERAKVLGEKGWKHVKVKMSTIYPTFEEYMRDWCGHSERDPEKGRFGYWENPNAKWDGYQFGGRWNGLIRIKEGVEPIRGERSWCNGDKSKEPDDPHTADAAYKEDIDFEGLELLTDGKIEEFWKKLEECKAAAERGEEGKAEDYFVRSQLINMGIVNGRKPMLSYLNGLSLEVLKTKYREHFVWSTYAHLDETGWHEPGKMGWWGCSAATPEARKEHHGSFLDWMKSKPDGTLFVVVDCHI